MCSFLKIVITPAAKSLR